MEARTITILLLLILRCAIANRLVEILHCRMNHIVEHDISINILDLILFGITAGGWFPLYFVTAVPLLIADKQGKKSLRSILVRWSLGDHKNLQRFQISHNLILSRKGWDFLLAISLIGISSLVHYCQRLCLLFS